MAVVALVVLVGCSGEDNATPADVAETVAAAEPLAEEPPSESTSAPLETSRPHQPRAALEIRPVLLQLPNDPFGGALAVAELREIEAAASSGGGDQSGDSPPDGTLPVEVDPAEVLTPRDETRPESVVVLTDPDELFLYVLGPVELTGEIVEEATAVPNRIDGDSWLVALTLSAEGGRAFDAVAETYLGQQLALVVDGSVLSAPSIQQANLGGSVVIGGDFSEQEATLLASSFG